MPKRSPEVHALASVPELMAAARYVYDVSGKGVVVGGLAMQMYGSQRLTGDLDVVFTKADASRLPLPRGRRLSFGGFSSLAPNGVIVDVIVRDDDFRRLYEKVASSGWRMRSGVPCVKVPYLAAMKLASGRPKDDEDLKTLVLLHPREIPAMRKVVFEQLGGAFAAREFDQMVMLARWEEKSGQR